MGRMRKAVYDYYIESVDYEENPTFRLCIITPILGRLYNKLTFSSRLESRPMEKEDITLVKNTLLDKCNPKHKLLVPISQYPSLMVGIKSLLNEIGRQVEEEENIKIFGHKVVHAYFMEEKTNKKRVVVYITGDYIDRSE